jgi:Tol biopolymer transport system component
MKINKVKSIGVISFIAILGALVSVAGIARQAEDPGVLLRAAIEKEEVDGNLQGAIDMYKQIVVKHGDNRAIAAKAQLRIGLCYEKLGREQAGRAQKAFEKVIESYPDQTEAVNLAKEKLTLLSRTQALKKAGSAEFSIRQVWAEPGTDTSGCISPDGRYLTFVDWETGDLAMRDLVSGTDRRLTNKGTWEQSPGEMAGESKWTRDGRRIVYQWYDKDGILELRVFDTKDSSIRTIHRDKTEDWVQAFDWSPDGRYVLASFFPGASSTPGRERGVGLISVEDGSVKALKGRFEDSMDYASIFLFSPDGKYIAYDATPAGEDTGRHDIFLISLDGQVEMPLVEHPEDDKVISWTPDGQGLLFASDRTGSVDLWFLPMSDGKPQEAPRLIKSGFGPVGSLGMTSRGELYFGSSGSARDIYVVDVEPGTWEARSPAKKLALPNQGRNLFANYSPDGQRMAFISLLMGGRHPVLNILYEKTGRVRELNPRLEGIQFPCWIPPDGYDLSVGTADKEGRIGLYRVNAQTGEAARLVQFEKGQGSQAQAWAADGKRFFYTAEVKSEGKRYIYTYDLETGKNERLPGSPDDARTIAVSPDGESLAVVNTEGKRTIKIMPASGGELREVYRFDFESGTLITPAWSIDGRYIYFPWPRDPQTNIADLYRVSRDGGEAERIDVGMRFIRGLTVRPDGQRIAFYSSGDKLPQPQVWIMENFLPKAK